MSGIHLKIHFKSFRTLPTFNQANEEGSLICLGQFLLRGVRGNQAIPHASTYQGSSSIREPFLIYSKAMGHSFGALLAQNNDQEHEQAIYYLSRTMIGAKHRYNMVEKECLALVFTVQKMRHYPVGQTIHVISKVDPLRLLITKLSSLNSRLAK